MVSLKIIKEKVNKTKDIGGIGGIRRTVDGTAKLLKKISPFNTVGKKEPLDSTKDNKTTYDGKSQTDAVDKTLNHEEPLKKDTNIIPENSC